MATDTDAATVTTDEAAQIAGVSARTIRRWIQRGVLPATPTQDGYLIAVADLAGVRTGAGSRSRSRDHTDAVTDTAAATDTDTVTDTALPVSVNPNARAQLEAIRDEWLQPLVATISQQAERIGRLEAERNSVSAQLAAKNETLMTKDELIADLRAELHRRAERDRAVAAQTATDALGAHTALRNTKTTAEPPASFWRRVWRALSGGAAARGA